MLLQGARDVFRSLLCDSAARLDALSRKLSSCIEKARPYYEARIRASEAAREAQDAAVQYERANSAHSAAREMVKYILPNFLEILIVLHVEICILSKSSKYVQ